MEPDVATEVPDNLKKFVRYVVRGFYPKEHALAIDLLLHHPCIKEEDMLELLKFERKQLRAVINTLKTDKFIKTRMRVETDDEEKTTKHNYYFINYSVFVNVVKYKLDHMRRKIETEERDATNRASYKCKKCEKCFTDLEADQLFDPMTCTFNCTYCGTEVEEEAAVEQKTDGRALMVTFNEQLAPLFNLLKEVEDIKLSHDILEPEPTDIHALQKGSSRAGGGAKGPGEKWSGDITKNRQYGFYNTDNQITINMEAEGDQKPADNKPKKERPVWMSESTVDGAVSEKTDTNYGVPESAISNPKSQQTKIKENDDIMKTLLAHEKKSSGPQVTGVPVSDSDSSTSDSEDEKPSTKPTDPTSFLTAFEDNGATSMAAVEEMESDDDEDAVTMVTMGGRQIPYYDVTPDMVEQMNASEKEEYIRVGQEMYQQMYD